MIMSKTFAARPRSHREIHRLCRLCQYGHLLITCVYRPPPPRISVIFWQNPRQSRGDGIVPTILAASRMCKWGVSEWTNPGLRDARQKQRADDEECDTDSERDTSGTAQVRHCERPQSTSSQLTVATIQREADVDTDHTDDERCYSQARQTVHQTTGRCRSGCRLQIERQADCAVE